MKTQISIIALVVVVLASVLIAAEPVGVIAKLDVRKGLVVVKTDSNQLIEYTLANSEQIKDLEAGQKVTFDLQAGILSLQRQQLRIKQYALPDTTLARKLGAGEFNVTFSRGLLTFKNTATGATAQMASSGSNPLQQGKPTIRVMAEKGTPGGGGGVGPGSCPAGYEERCVIASTGSSPGPEDDVVSCTCIRQ